MINDIIHLLNEIVSANALIDSIYFYDNYNTFVITDSTKFTKLDFVDKGIFDVNFDTEYCAVRRKAKNLMLQEKDVISYITRFNYFSNTKITYFVINLNYEELFVNSVRGNLDHPMELLIYDGDKNIIYTSDNSIISDLSIIDRILETSTQNPVAKIADDEYFISKTRTEKPGWFIAYIQPYSGIMHTADMLKRLSIPVSFVVLLLSFIIAYIFTVYLYKPMAKLIFEVEKYAGISLKKENAYYAINEVLKNTFIRYNELLYKYQFAFPYFRNNFVNEILDEESSDIEKFKEALTLIDIDFKFTNFVTVLFDFENTKFSIDIEAAIKEYFFRARKDTVYLLSRIKDERIVIIINTDRQIEGIYSLLSGLKAELNKNGIEMTISLGQIYDNLDKMCSSISDVLILLCHSNSCLIIFINRLRYFHAKSVKPVFKSLSRAAGW